eukprot:259225_1
MIRFYPKDISNVLPHLFTEQYNNQTFKYTTKAKQLTEKLSVIKDLRFESFYLAISNICYPVMETKLDNVSYENESTPNLMINEEEKEIQLPQTQSIKSSSRQDNHSNSTTLTNASFQESTELHVKQHDSNNSRIKFKFSDTDLQQLGAIEESTTTLQELTEFVTKAIAKIYESLLTKELNEIIDIIYKSITTREFEDADDLLDDIDDRQTSLLITKISEKIENNKSITYKW